jgi:aldose 1-epimerase
MYYTNILPNKVQLSSGSSIIEIWPMEGAILNSWQYQHMGKPVSIIEGYHDVTDFARHAESKGFRSCKLSPYVCRLKHGQYRFDASSYDIGKFKLGDHMIHGLLYDVPFEVINSESNEQLAMVILRHNYTGADKGYPFHFDMLVTYSLSEQNKVTITTEFINLHHRPIPVADGWHPYFSLGAPVNQLSLQMASDTMVVFDEQLLPTGAVATDTRFATPTLLGNTTLDNCFLLNKTTDQPACTLLNPDNGLRLSIYAVSNYPYLQLYTPPHRHSIAIENLSSAPDAFNNNMGLIVLEPGERIAFSCAYEVSSE